MTDELERHDIDPDDESQWLAGVVATGETLAVGSYLECVRFLSEQPGEPVVGRFFISELTGIKLATELPELTVGDHMSGYKELQESMTRLANSDCFWTDAEEKLDTAEEWYAAVVVAHRAAVKLMDQAGRFLHEAEDEIPLTDED